MHHYLLEDHPKLGKDKKVIIMINNRRACSQTTQKSYNITMTIEVHKETAVKQRI